jgi:hypothetical protein
MAKKVQNIGLYVLIALVILLGIYLMCSRVEGFKDEPVPDYCGKYGYYYSDGIQKIIKDIDGGTLPTNRLYTSSDCTSVGGNYQFNQCVKLKNEKKNEYGYYEDMSPKNIIKDFGEVCKGLNSKKTPAPAECNMDGKPLGKGNVAATFTFKNRTLTLPQNSIRIYTQDECETTLKGMFINVATIEKQTKNSLANLIKAADNIISIEDVNKILDANGRDMGICFGKDVPYSLACSSATEPSFFQKIIAEIKKAL